MNKPMTASDMLAARKELTRLGILEDSGERRPNRDGVMAVVWKMTPLGRLVGNYERLGMTFRQALAKARSSDPQSVD